MTQYLAVDASTKKILRALGRPDAPDLVGPPAAAPLPEDGIEFYPWQQPMSISDGPAPAAVLTWADAPVWVVPLADIVEHAIDQIDGAADKARLTVSPAGRDLEYQRAQAQAQAYKDAAYTGPVPACVDSWARAKQWSARNAAIEILATADAWCGALDGIRDLRLNAKEGIRRVTGDGADIAPIVSKFLVDLSNLMKGLQ